MASVEKLHAVHEIEQNIYRYARGVDRRDWAVVRSSYHPDGYDHHGSYEGGIDGLIQWMRARHENIQYSIHLITNISIEFLPDCSSITNVDTGGSVNDSGSPVEAFVETYFTAYQRIALPKEEGGSVDNQSIGRYLDHVTCRDNCWKVQKRTVVFDFYFTQPASDSSRLPAGALRSMRDGNDPGMRMRETLLINRG